MKLFDWYKILSYEIGKEKEKLFYQTRHQEETLKILERFGN